MLVREALLRWPKARRARAAGILAPVILGVVGFSAATSVATISGYSAAAGEQEMATEARYRKLISPDEIAKFHRYLTAEPHPAGSKRNNELARWIADEWRKQGLEDVTIHEYDVLNSSPREVSLEMVKPKYFRAGLREDAYESDPDTKNPDISGAYLGYSASGDVTAPVVYAHSGNPEDYEYLKKHGIDVHGKIVLVRYSNPYSYRGFKALTAERLGAAAILIYSDPAEDGDRQGPVYPTGPWGPESHIQRGAITYDFLQPGDPLTPGWASVPGAKRISPAEAISLPKIMGVPLSWRDAKPLLENMGGEVAPESWQGGLPLKYHLGGKRVRVHLKVDMDTREQPYYVTEARIRGGQDPDEWVILGNHRDAWVFGGVDPSSGTAAMLELTRGLGELLRRGIRPRRTLVICSWDGEEYALTGSTEWGEQYAEELQRKAVAYLNVDEATSGRNFQGEAVGSLAPLLLGITGGMDAPSGVSLYEEWKLTRQAELHGAQPPLDSELVNTRIGSGSDHTVFLNHLGIPTIELSFTGPYGVYHSAYDDLFWMNHFGDPGYRYHALMSQLWGSLALRMADAEILPFDFEAYGENLKKFVSDLDESGGVRSHANLESLSQHIASFQSAGHDLNHAISLALANGRADAVTTSRVNQLLMQIERNWCNADGIPGRPWFKHTIYGTRSTYAHLELPALAEAAEARDWKRAAEQAQMLDKELSRNTEILRQARDMLEKSAERQRL